ncbi:MAG: hypothetical protein WC455_17815 [Dehalococcoidia bacterium]
MTQPRRKITKEMSKLRRMTRGRMLIWLDDVVCPMHSPKDDPAHKECERVRAAIIALVRRSNARGKNGE